MIAWIAAVLLVSCGVPIAKAWKANQRRALRYTVGWTVMAWLAWCANAWLAATEQASSLVCYLSLALTGCAFMGVLGARRPGATAWNFVLIGLLAVLLLPVGERWIAGGAFGLDALQVVLISAVLCVGVLNFLPTNLGPAAICVGIACGLELWALLQPEGLGWRTFAFWMIGSAPWLALECVTRSSAVSTLFDQRWLSFRNRFGLVWGQRLRDQFNRSARHAGWPVTLTWGGLRRKNGTTEIDAAVQQKMLAVLDSLMKRFGQSES